MPATFESRALVPARRFRELKAAPEDIEIEVVGLIDQSALALQALELVALPVIEGMQ